MEKQKQRGYGFWRRGMAAVLVMSTVLLGPRCAAQVLTTVEEAGPADCVYIAGNPDLYPIEYYDRMKAREYRARRKAQAAAAQPTQ